MGEAYDEQGRILGSAMGRSKREVFDKLVKAHADAAEIRIRRLKEEEKGNALPTIDELEAILAANPDAPLNISPEGGAVANPRPPATERSSAFRKELESVLNKHSMENGSSTPDFVLADFLVRCLQAFDAATRRRASWYGRSAGQGLERPKQQGDANTDPSSP